MWLNYTQMRLSIVISSFVSENVFTKFFIIFFVFTKFLINPRTPHEPRPPMLAMEGANYRHLTSLSNLKKTGRTNELKFMENDKLKEVIFNQIIFFRFEYEWGTQISKTIKFYLSVNSLQTFIINQQFRNVKSLN